MHIPEPYYQAIDGFGHKRWVRGASIPALYVCKDMTVNQVTSKIKNIMLE